MTGNTSLHLSLTDYHISQMLALKCVPVAALIAAAIRRGDSDVSTRLQKEFPNLVTDLQMRYNSPMGLLEVESIFVNEQNTKEDIYARSLDIAGRYFRE